METISGMSSDRDFVFAQVRARPSKHTPKLFLRRCHMQGLGILRVGNNCRRTVLKDFAHGVTVAACI
ncbi:hypothetical protein DPMN_053033 [Dreissena polymorpha]|uniref:Uncharacterized protein n=1 Tax=Dreissena polymorpha TaxID=45954 RepID=A0A9D4HRT0_DREPO|nr:hypothetical protein DPMN_053033 [Dreissena polymorpha]